MPSTPPPANIQMQEPTINNPPPPSQGKAAQPTFTNDNDANFSEITVLPKENETLNLENHYGFIMTDPWNGSDPEE